MSQIAENIRRDGITSEGMAKAFADLAKKDPKLWVTRPWFLMGITEQVTPRRVLDLQGNLAEVLEPGRDGTPSRLGSYLDALAGAELGTPGSVDVSSLVFEHVLTSRAIRIGASMNEEILLRAGDVGLLGRTARFGEDIAPTRHRGFAVLEKTLWIPEIRSRTQAVHAVSWGFLQLAATDRSVFNRGWFVVFWGDVSRDVDPVLEEVVKQSVGIPEFVEAFGRWAPIMCFPIIKGAMVGGEYSHLDPERLADIERLGQTPNFEAFRPERLVAAIWQLLGETIEAAESTTLKERPVAKTVGRRRASIKPEVTVCVLRRPSRPTINPGSGKKRTERTWVEGGFERTYWTGPGRSIPVKRVIGGYWSVDDESLPIKNRPRVDDLRR